MSIVLKKRCPCCKNKLSFFHFYFKRKRGEEGEVLICTSCNKYITIERQNIAIIIILSIFIFIISIATAVMIDIFDFILILIVLGIPYVAIDYVATPLKCKDVN